MKDIKELTNFDYSECSNETEDKANDIITANGVKRCLPY